MPSLTVLLTNIFQPKHLATLRADYPDVAFVQLDAEGKMPPEGHDARVLFRCYMSKPDLQRVLREAPGIEWIHTCTAGFDQLLVPEISERGLIVTRSAGALNVPMAEFVLAYMLLVTKRFPGLFRAQAEHAWRPPDPDELGGKTVGIIGAGAIGVEVARRCAAMGMRVIGTKRTPTPLPYFDEVLGPDALMHVLEQSDFVLLACPLTSETRDMIGETELRAMKPDAYLLNIARGALIQEDVLIRALREGWIAGACLDAFVQEPLPPEHPFWDLENVVVTPHSSYRSPYSTDRAVEEFKANLRRFLEQAPLENQLKDLALGY